MNLVGIVHSRQGVPEACASRIMELDRVAQRPRTSAKLVGHVTHGSRDLSKIEQGGDSSPMRNAVAETRSFELVEIRALDGGGLKLFGHAAVFDKLSADLGGFKEKVAKGAFAESIRTDDIVALWAHDSKLVMARKRAGTLKLSEDRDGLAFEIDMPETEQGRGWLETIRRGDVDQASFSFITLEDQWETQGKDAIRTLIKVQLRDVSPVTFAAYPQTDVGVRASQAAPVPRYRRSAEEPVTSHEELLLRQRQAEAYGPVPVPRYRRSPGIDHLWLRQRLAEAEG